MTRFKKTTLLAVCTGLFGVLLTAHPSGMGLEENLGLSLLFQMRGVREAPSEVVVVALDSASVDHFELPRDLSKWPRSLHAQLVKKLSDAGASVIAFDIFFRAAREGDPMLGEAIEAAGNVVLIESTEQKMPPSKKGANTVGENIIFEKRVLPHAPLAEASVAVAPFPLPKVPVRVNEFWLFKNNSADSGTLPVIVLQLFALQVFDEMIVLFENVLHHSSVIQAKKEPALTASFDLLQDLMTREKSEMTTGSSLNIWVRDLRRIFEKKTVLSEALVAEMEKPSRTYPVLLKALIKMYAGGASRYLNYYGPPGSLETLPYFEVFEGLEQSSLDLRGKAVFIGSSEIVSISEKQDDFHTVFSQPDGLKLSGVEIAATAFANLLKDESVRRAPLVLNFMSVFFFGVLIAVCWFLGTPLKAAMATFVAGVVFIVLVFMQFKHSGMWFSLIVPLLFQTPFAGFTALLWRYLDSKREQKEIKKAFAYFLPDRVVAHLSHRVEDLRAGNQLVHGTVLYTDIENYTTLSESMPPKALGILMSDYYEAIFAPVERHGGIVLNVTGDAMLAIWPAPQDDPLLRKQACETALEVCEVLHHFNRDTTYPALRTRLGLHCGQVMLGSIGGGHRLEYTAIGDMANTAARIEGLNKTLGTRLLASEGVLMGLEGFLARELGVFLLRGKSRPIGVHELISDVQSCSANQVILCRDFRSALDLYRRRRWPEAVEAFSEMVDEAESDGPARYYITLCKHLITYPPEEVWDGIISIKTK
ncbi:Adenylate cyclase [hydrothermal vent metagenome]|uniref:Adenylate cyclase n=1 Tax=hydrothermal vent metagenome TaxID=652676 RepID=A0A3B1D4W0_9ZZZZ